MNRTAFFTGALVVLALALADSLPAEPAPYRSPFDLAFSPDGKTLAVSDHTAASVALVDVGKDPPCRRHVALSGKPAGVAWSRDGSAVFVAEYGAGTVAEIDVATGALRRRIDVGLRPVGLAIAPERRLLIAANTVTDDVSVVDLETGAEKARIRVPREPYFVDVTPDESLAVVGNLLPSGSPEDPTLGAVVSVIDLQRLQRIDDIRLPAGSTSVREVQVSPDGRWAYAVHTVGRFNVPSTQLERGWVNTNALSVLDLGKRQVHATVLLDHPFQGSTDPWGLALSADGATLWISLRGVHEIARIDVARLHRLLDGKEPGVAEPQEGDSYATGTRDIWSEIKRDPSRRNVLVNDLSALHVADLITRFPLAGNGPRGLELSPNGDRLATAMYYSGTVALVDAKTGRVSSSVCLGPSPEPDPARRGEMIFHDATICFQRWVSCSTCHPDNARTDGLRWDLLNDGLGTPQRTRSLLLSHKTGPTTARGVRKGLHESVPKGLLFLLRKPEPELTEPLIAYLESLKPEPSPYLVNGALSESARRGKALFEGKARCVKCHTGELGTDKEAYDVGTKGKFDRREPLFYTPKLVELYRTAPYLHDARAATLEEVFTRHDPEERHGKWTRLDDEEMKDLIAYLKSL